MIHTITLLVIGYCISRCKCCPTVKALLTSPFGSLMPHVLSTLLVCWLVHHAHHLKWQIASTMKILMSTVVSLLCMPCRKLTLLASLYTLCRTQPKSSSGSLSFPILWPWWQLYRWYVDMCMIIYMYMQFFQKLSFWSHSVTCMVVKPSVSSGLLKHAGRQQLLW